MLKYLAVAIAALAFSGCIIQHDSTSTVSNERLFNEANYDGIEVNVTTKPDIMAKFGIPDRKDKDSKGREYWEYVGKIKQDSSGGIILVLDTSNTREEEKKVTFVFNEQDVLVELIK